MRSASPKLSSSSLKESFHWLAKEVCEEVFFHVHRRSDSYRPSHWGNGGNLANIANRHYPLIDLPSEEPACRRASRLPCQVIDGSAKLLVDGVGGVGAGVGVASVYRCTLRNRPSLVLYTRADPTVEQDSPVVSSHQLSNKRHEHRNTHNGSEENDRNPLRD